jgi:hypothetical protein
VDNGSIESYEIVFHKHLPGQFLRGIAYGSSCLVAALPRWDFRGENLFRQVLLYDA